MQAVILAAGKSTRTSPLTVNKPKPLLKVLDKTVMEHNLDQLHGIVDEVIIIVGFMKEAIIERFGSFYKGMKLVYVEQKEQLGTGHALLAAKPFLKDRFIVMGGDDLFCKKDIEALVRHKCAVLVQKVDDITRFGAVIVEKNKVKEIIEKPKEQIDAYANTAMYILDKSVFDIELKKSPRGEYELTDYITALAKKGLVEYELVKGYWISIGYPWHYLEANVAFLRMIKESKIDKSAIVEQNVTMKGLVVVGKNTIIKSGTYIEGPVFIGDDCAVGPCAYLRPDTILMNNVRTRGEHYDVVIMDGTTSKHPCYLCHSVIGERCNIGYGTLTADYRHDAGENWTMVNGMKFNTCVPRRARAYRGQHHHLPWPQDMALLHYSSRRDCKGRYHDVRAYDYRQAIGVSSVRHHSLHW
jgi:bifunctional UDP-N-acetylglucosamine pyrophosphorylase/glucosamine-1-phosphate N-acetyltransferase